MRQPLLSLRLSVALLALCAGAQVQAQGQPPEVVSCERTRAEVRNECVEFMRTYRWDEAKGDYVPRIANKGKPGAQPPEGVKSRAEVRAERDKFIKANRWNDTKAQWEPIAGAPRDIATMSREEVRKETQAFMRSHRWDEATQAYVDRPAKGK
jgi:hypothetical protein